MVFPRQIWHLHPLGAVQRSSLQKRMPLFFKGGFQFSQNISFRSHAGGMEEGKVALIHLEWF